MLPLLRTLAPCAATVHWPLLIVFIAVKHHAGGLATVAIVGIQVQLISGTVVCIHCGRTLNSSPEPDAGDWIIRCLSCGARNIIVPVLKFVGWR